MYENSIRHLPIVEGGKLIGVISDRDIKLAFAVDGDKAKTRLTGDSCTSDPYSADVSEHLRTVAFTMSQRTIGCCVVTERDQVVGILTATDACRVLSQLV